MEGDWLVAQRQDAGRGRQGRAWQGLDGNYFGSTLIELQDDDPPASSLSLVSGLALLDAVQLSAPQADLVLKWPNDLMLRGAKLAGILLERSGSRVVAGFGVNLAAAPEIEGRDTIALTQDANVLPTAFAPLLAGAMARMLSAWRSSGPSAMTMAWMQRSYPIGTQLCVHDSDGERREGLFAGLEDDGALRLKVGSEVEIVRTGDVSLASSASNN